MTRQQYTMAPPDELRFWLMDSVGHELLRVAGGGALVRLPDRTLGVVATFGQAGKKLHVLTEEGTVRVDGDQLVMVLASPVLAAKLLIHLARTLAALAQPDEP